MIPSYFEDVLHVRIALRLWYSNKHYTVYSHLGGCFSKERLSPHLVSFFEHCDIRCRAHLPALEVFYINVCL